MCPYLIPFQRVRTTTPYLSSATIYTITVRTNTSAHVLTITCFDHRHRCRCLECMRFLSAGRSDPDSALRALFLACRLELRQARSQHAGIEDEHVGSALSTSLPHSRRTMRSNSGRAPSRSQPLGVDDSEVGRSGGCSGECEAQTFT